MIFRIVVLFILCMLGFSCKNITEKISQNYSIDTVLIKIDENFLQAYNASMQNRICNEKLFTYNPKNHSIDIFDLKEKKSIKQIQLQREGNNGVLNMNAFYVTPSFFIFQTGYQYILVDYNGEVIKKISREKILDVNADYMMTKKASISNFEILAFDELRNEIVVPIYPKKNNDYKDKNCIATINIDSEEITILPTPYPSNFSKQNFGMLRNPSILCKGDSIIYNYPMSSKIYIYNRNLNTLIEKNIPSSYTANISVLFPANKGEMELIDHYLKEIFFHDIKYDNYRNQYYRLHVDKSKDLSVFNNRKSYLTIMDENFQLVKEIAFVSDIYPVYNITPEGLLFEFMQLLFEEEFAYSLITSEDIPLVPYPKYEKKENLSQEYIPKNEFNSESVMEQKNDFFDMDLLFQSDGREFIYEHLIYPTYEYENNIEGMALVILERDESGNIINYNIPEDASDGTITENMKQELLRIVYMIKKIDPEKYPVICGFQVPFDINRYNRKHNIQD